MQSIANKMINRIYGHGRGWAFTPKDFADLGERSSIDISLNRLIKKGTIRRIMRGIYDYPRISKLFNAPASPEPDQIANAIARIHSWSISPSGETALNILGLSTQVPGNYLFYSDGPSKKYFWNGGEIIFERRAIKETSAVSSTTALLIQALKALGEEHITKATIMMIRKKMVSAHIKTALRESQYITEWVYEKIKTIAEKE